MIVEILIALLCLMAGAAIVYFLQQRKVNMLGQERTQLSNALAMKTTLAETLEERIGEERERGKSQIEELTSRYKEQLAELDGRHEQELQQQEARYEREKTEAKERFDRRLRESLSLVQEQLKTATEQLLRQRSKELDENNQTQMGALINPLRETISEMKRAMDDHRDAQNRNTATLAEQLRQM